MNKRIRILAAFVLLFAGFVRPGSGAGENEKGAQPAKRVLSALRGDNVLKPDNWRPWQLGFEMRDGLFMCDNGSKADAQRGASQTVVLNQQTPAPIVATAWSKAEAVSGAPDSNYALYLDLIYTDGTPLWGQVASFATGSHDWQRKQVVVVPEKPVRQVAYHLLFRGHSGRAWFRSPALHVVQTPADAVLFDGVPCIPISRNLGFQVRDVAANSDFVHPVGHNLGLRLTVQESAQDGAVWIDATVEDVTGRDRAVSLAYTVPIDFEKAHWLHDPRTELPAQAPREYMNASPFRVGGGRLSRYPLGAVASGQLGQALAIDMAKPAFYRIGYNSSTRELFLVFDLGLAPEHPRANVRFCRYSFDPEEGFRSALDRYYRLCPDAFRCRMPRQGLWMPFAKVSEVEGWEDFGFRFKEGNNETEWDDAHGLLTFRYTEPMTWWMRMPVDQPRTMPAALNQAKRLASEGDRNAMALMTSGYHDPGGQFVARLLDRPWCNGAVWSMNSLPGIEGQTTDFKNQWNEQIRQRYYGPQRRGDLDGEYIDSSEGYVTDELDFRRDHFAAAETPLTFAPDSHDVGIFRGLIAFEYIRAIARDVHAMDKWMMANSTPSRLCWLAPLLDVMGTETDWNPGGAWRPMPVEQLLYRRAICSGKPFCFLMNTQFERFSHDLVERYMKRALAFGMFPGFFSHNASQGHYFTRPELYNRDRPLFRKYVPLCRLVAEAGWQPLTGAACDDRAVCIERFGDRYLTVLNDSDQSRTVEIQLKTPGNGTSKELTRGETLQWRNGRLRLSLAPEDVCLVTLP